MLYTDANKLVGQIKLDMRTAMKEKDSIKLDELKSLLARITNAEAVPLTRVERDRIVGVTSGVGTTEIARKQLTLSETQSIIADEVRELEHALLGLDAKSEYAEILRNKLAVVQKYVQ